MKGSLVLEDGTVARGVLFGARKSTFGEFVFSTNMTGYCESLTDPSYHGQILMMTYPLIGNYGVDDATTESNRIQVSGFVVREACPTPNHPTSKKSLDQFLREEGVPGLHSVDTRSLTIKTRVKGTMRAVLLAEGEEPEDFMEEVRRQPYPDTRNLVADVSCRKTIVHKGKGDKKVVLVDCGVKRSIVEYARQFADVLQVPYDVKPEVIRDLKPDGVIVSNGPGDPAHPDLQSTLLRTIKEIANEIPTLGICLGHQILALAFGGATYKLKFGHRGGNQPVKNMADGKVYITSQNHGFAVKEEGLDDSGFTVTQLNLNDGSVEAMKHKKLPIISVQYHPEASPGPWDNRYIFQDFERLLRR